MTRNGLIEATEHAFRGLGEGLNRMTAEDRGPADEPDEIWIPTDLEAEGVAKPVGRILARHLPDIPGGSNDDAGDLIAAAIPFGIWLVRGVADFLPRTVGKHRKPRGAQDQDADQ